MEERPKKFVNKGGAPKLSAGRKSKPKLGCVAAIGPDAI